MNVYQIRKDGEYSLWIAPNMCNALQQAEDAHVADNEGDWEGGSETLERNYYRTELVESCTLVGDIADASLANIISGRVTENSTAAASA